MLTLGDVLDKINEQQQVGYSVRFINVVNRCPEGELDWSYGQGDDGRDILMNPNDWKRLKAEIANHASRTGAPYVLDALWGVPVVITDTALADRRLSVRFRSDGVRHKLEVFDKGGNKLGEVDGVRGATFQANQHGYGELSVDIRVEDGGLDGP